MNCEKVLEGKRGRRVHCGDVHSLRLAGETVVSVTRHPDTGGDNSVEALVDRFALMYQAISKSGGLWLGLIVVASSLTLIGSSPSGASSMSQSSLKCGSDQLSVVWRGTTGGLAGSFGDLFWIRNNGAFPCVISGYPIVAVYLKDKRLPTKTWDFKGRNGNDQMGVAPGRRTPSIRLLSGRVASFWIFGSDVMSKCINADKLTVSVTSLTGMASIPVPKGFQAWTYCGGGFEVNPLVPGVSGSYPSRPLRSEIMQ